MFSLSNARSLGLLALTVPLLTGCPGSLRDPGRFSLDVQPPQCTMPSLNVERDIFQARCTGMGCHDGTQPAAALDLVQPGVRERLVGVRSVMCMRQPLINPMNRNQGVFFDKVTMPMPPCGAPMPLTGAMLTPAEVDCIRAWAFEGSTGDGGTGDGGTGDGGGMDAAVPNDAARDGTGGNSMMQVPRTPDRDELLAPDDSMLSCSANPATRCSSVAAVRSVG